MKEIKAIIQPFMLHRVLDTLHEIEGLPAVSEVHDLHIWAMSTTETALTAHLVRTVPTCDDALLARACQELHDKFGIEHVTLQFETGNVAHPCGQAPDEVI